MALLVGVALLCAPTGLLAAVPTTVQIHGRLSNQAGAATPDGTYILTFSLYAGKSAKAALWKEIVKQKTKSGVFRHVLGSVQPLPNTKLATSKALWLGVTVDNDAELPRTPLHAAVYARRAAVARGLDCVGCVTAAQLGKGTVTPTAVSFNYASSDTQGGVATAAKTADFAKSAATASDIKCTGCVSVSELKFDGDIDLGVRSLVAAKLTAESVVAKTIAAGSFVGNGSALTDVRIVGGKCKPGENVTGVKPNGVIQCGKPPDNNVKGGKCKPGQVVTEVRPDGTVVCAAMPSGQPQVSAAPPGQCTVKNLGAMYFDTSTTGLRYCSGNMWVPIALNCGNGTIDPGEQCDDGNLGTTDGCLPNCLKASGSCKMTCFGAGRLRSVSLQGTLFAKDGAAYDGLGHNVDISGNVGVMSAPGHDHNGKSSGGVFVFSRQLEKWEQMAELSPHDATAGDNFGSAVAVDGKTIVAGAVGSAQKGQWAGAAYIFDQQAGSKWTQTAKIFSSSAAAGRYFGNAVDIAGDIVLVGEYQDSQKATAAGAAHIFRRSANGSWSHRQKLTAADGAVRDYFGHEVALSGDTALIAADGDDDKGTGSGSAYVFSRDKTGKWIQSAKLLAQDGAKDDYFGIAVAIDGGVAIVGAFGDDDRASRSGAAYVFARQNDGTWKQAQKLVPRRRATNCHFGNALALQGGVLAVGAPGDDESAEAAGSVHVYHVDPNGVWRQSSKLLAKSGQVNDRFGWRVSVSAGAILVAAYGKDDKAVNAGAGYVFTPSSVCDSGGACICRLGYGGSDCSKKMK